MGIVCPCGVRVNAVSQQNRVKFEGVPGTVCGTITYTADVCVSTPGSSRLILRFVDTENNGAQSFTFTATSFKQVTCCKEDYRCDVTIRGTGIINGITYGFQAIFSDYSKMAKADVVKEFEIYDFFDQLGAAPVKQGSIVARGCK
ncbi:hypothetical protein HNO89_003226 [Sporosarcina luteola]|nr:hypothetical protein [Sporosarcina luteola]